MPTGWTPAAASSTLEEWTRTFSRSGQQCSCFRITVFYTAFGLESRKFASEVRKYGKLSHFLTHRVVYGEQEKKTNNYLSTANVYRLSRVKVSGTCVQPFQRYRLRSANFDKFCIITRRCQGFVGQSSPNLAHVSWRSRTR